MENPPFDVQQTPPADDIPKIPDYLASPNAVFSDKDVQWRYGRAPDYTKTRKVWAEGKRKNHEPGSLEEMVENLVKNWEVEASFKPRLSDWRTIDHEKYSFAMGGGPPQDAEHMIRVGTYNGIIAPNEYYSPENSDFATSHKTFKRMMPTFAWEVLEVYSGPPRVAFRWRHWGYMKNDYVAFNNKAQKVTAKAHGGIIDIEGVTVAEVDDQVRLQAVQTWMDPLEMFRQIAPRGIVNQEAMNRKVNMEAALDVGPDGSSPHPVARELDAAGATCSKSADDQHVTAESRNVRNQDSDPPESDRATTTSADGPAPPPPSAVGGASGQSDASNPEPLPAQKIVETAATQGAHMSVDKPPSNAQEVTEIVGAIISDSTTTAAQSDQHRVSDHPDVARSVSPFPSVAGDEESFFIAAARHGGVVDDESPACGSYDHVDKHLETSARNVHPQPKDVEQAVEPGVGEAVVAGEQSQETKITREEMRRFGASECPFLMNRE